MVAVIPCLTRNPVEQTARSASLFDLRHVQHIFFLRLSPRWMPDQVRHDGTQTNIPVIARLVADNGWLGYTVLLMSYHRKEG